MGHVLPLRPAPEDTSPLKRGDLLGGDGDRGPWAEEVWGIVVHTRRNGMVVYTTGWDDQMGQWTLSERALTPADRHPDQHRAGVSARLRRAYQAVMRREIG